ncbi:MAG TPA: DinB family protein [Acidimicrobiales bacterium]|nr:DinB family protein [Acidimicrobiales bacterium]
MERTDPDLAADERTMLTQFLDYHRATLVGKVRGLDAAGLRTQVGRSGLTLAGLLKHAALNEDHWFSVILHDRPQSEPWASAPWDRDADWEFHTAVDDDLGDLLALYEATCERSRAAIAEVPDLGTPSARTSRQGERFTARWILLHMLEETARHNDHADLLRENVDGATGE